MGLYRDGDAIRPMKRASDSISGAGPGAADPFAYETSGTISFTLTDISLMKVNSRRRSDIVHIGNIPFYVSVLREIGAGEQSFLTTHVRVDERYCLMPLIWRVNIKLRHTLHIHDGDVLHDSLTDTLMPAQNTGCGSKLMEWTKLVDKQSKFDEVKITTVIDILSSDGFFKKRMTTFEKSPLTDACLVVEDREVHVNRGFLATCSPYFYKLFYGGFADKDQERIHLKDVSYEEFTHFLRIFHSDDISSDSLECVMKLADLFDCQMVMDKCVDFLCNRSIMHLVDRIVLAVKYRRFDAEAKCMSEIGSVDECIEYSRFRQVQTGSDRLKILFFRKFSSFEPRDDCSSP